MIPHAQTITARMSHAVKPALLVLASAALVQPIAHAKNDTANATKRLNDLLQKTQSMQANFTQTTKVKKAPNQKVKQRSGMSGLKVSGLNKTFSGSMMVQRPNKFRWHTKAPAEQLIVANNKTLWIYDPDLEQATRQAVDKQMANTPALLLSGDSKAIAKNFKVTQPKASQDTFVLYPKSENAAFQSLALAFLNGTPKAMVLNDSLGQQTTITFKQVRLNKSIAAKNFKFSAPEGVDVIEQ